MNTNKGDTMNTTTDTVGRTYQPCPACAYMQTWDSARCCECGA